MGDNKRRYAKRVEELIIKWDTEVDGSNEIHHVLGSDGIWQLATYLADELILKIPVKKSAQQ